MVYWEIPVDKTIKYPRVVKTHLGEYMVHFERLLFVIVKSLDDGNLRSDVIDDSRDLWIQREDKENYCMRAEELVGEYLKKNK